MLYDTLEYLTANVLALTNTIWLQKVVMGWFCILDNSVWFLDGLRRRRLPVAMVPYLFGMGNFMM